MCRHRYQKCGCTDPRSLLTALLHLNAPWAGRLCCSCCCLTFRSLFGHWSLHSPWEVLPILNYSWTVSPVKQLCQINVLQTVVFIWCWGTTTTPNAKLQSTFIMPFLFFSWQHCTPLCSYCEYSNTVIGNDLLCFELTKIPLLSTNTASLNHQAFNRSTRAGYWAC